MEIAAVDDNETLYVSSDIDDWDQIHRLDIRVILDFEGDLDRGVPTLPGSILYVYFPMHDNHDLPNMAKLSSVVRMAADLYRKGYRVLTHCGMGLNRSALVAGLILIELGWKGPEVVERLCERRAGALFNPTFRSYLLGL
jgi:Dual specificity phosphatase, catalytic domain